MSPQGKSGRGCWLILLIASAANAIAFSASAQDLLGAKEAIRKVRDQEENSSPAGESSELVKTIRALPAKLDPLPPAAAAAAWLAVYDQWQALPKDVRAGRFQSQFSKLFDALPSPEAWPALADLIDARPVAGTGEARMRSLALRMLGHRLTGRSELLKQDVEQAMNLVRDLARLWTAARDQGRLSKADATSSLFELKASKKALDEAKIRQPESDRIDEEFGLQSHDQVEFSSHVALAAIATIIQSSER